MCMCNHAYRVLSEDCLHVSLEAPMRWSKVAAFDAWDVKGRGVFTLDVKRLSANTLLYIASRFSWRSTHRVSLKCNYVAIGEVWMPMWQFIVGSVYHVRRHVQTHTHTHFKAFVQTTINEWWWPRLVIVSACLSARRGHWKYSVPD